MTRKQRVLECLYNAKLFKINFPYGLKHWISGGWVPRQAFCDPSVGGAEGTKRLRELKEGDIDYEWRYYFVPIKNGNYSYHNFYGFYKTLDGLGDYRKTDTTIYRLLTPLKEIDLVNCCLK